MMITRLKSFFRPRLQKLSAFLADFFLIDVPMDKEERWVYEIDEKGHLHRKPDYASMFYWPPGSL